MPLGEEVEDRKYRVQSQAASQKAWASCLSQLGTSGHVSTSCPQKTNQALCRTFVCLHVGGIWPCSINRLLTSPRQNSICVDDLQAHSKIRVQSGFNNFIQYLRTERLTGKGIPNMQHCGQSCALNPNTFWKPTAMSITRIKYKVLDFNPNFTRCQWYFLTAHSLYWCLCFC